MALTTTVAPYTDPDQLVADRWVYPPDAPGLPSIGPDLEFAAWLEVGCVAPPGSKKSKEKEKPTSIQLERFRAHLDELVYSVLYHPHTPLGVTTGPARREIVSWVGGHIWGQHAKAWAVDDTTASKPDGPRPSRVMVVGKCCGVEEEIHGRNMVGASGAVLVGLLDRLKIERYKRWYLTNLVKFRPPADMTTLRSGWIADGKYLLQQELRLVRPELVLCLGADAAKALLGNCTVSGMDGRVAEIEYCTGLTAADPRPIKALAMVVLHPAQVAREKSMERVLERGLARFGRLVQGHRFDLEKEDVDHRVIEQLEDLEALLWEIEHDPDKTDKVIAADAEWHGQHPVNKGSYLRTIQFAWRPGHAFAVKLRGPCGVGAFTDRAGTPAGARALLLLKQWLADKRVVGHFFNADLEWLVDIGLDLRDRFASPREDAPDGTPAWARTRTEGGADTGLMAHAIEETALYGLESLCARYTDVPRYDVPMAEWCKQQKENFGVLEGYGEAPDELLLPYAIWDADATLRLFYALDPLLDCDYEGNCCREPFWESMAAAPAVLEIHQTGITVDKARVDELTEVFLTGRDGLEVQIREWAQWPAFNIRSVFDVREFLFGTQHRDQYDDEGNPRSGRPPEALSLELEPILDTSKPPRLWADLVARGKTEGRRPGTGKSVLPQLAMANPEYMEQINWVRDHRFLDQVLKSVLRPPVADKDGAWLRDEETGLIYDAGLAACICDDGRVRTHVYQTKETGRWSSARPPLQNISKSRDADYSRLLGVRYKRKLRSVLRASPGTMLVEADYSGAELFATAVMADDAVMLDHAQRSLFPDEGFDEKGNPCPGGKYPHPRYYDIHSNIAVLAFQLSCAPTKQGLKSIGKGHFRTLAKRVIFGLMYGQGAKGSMMLAREEGVKATVEDAQAVIDAVHATYKGLEPFFASCRDRVLNPGWLCHGYGRFRRFPAPQDEKTLGDFERQAMNFPIQGMIASAVNRAIANLYHYRFDVGRPDLYRILLQIHDAILLEVPCENIGFVANEVIPYCMRDLVPVYPTDLDGFATGRGPYYLGFGIEVSNHWGEALSNEECRERFGVVA